MWENGRPDLTPHTPSHHMDLPPWLAAPEREVTGHSWVDEARRRLHTARVPVTLVGQPGSGRTLAAAAVVARHSGPVLGARLTGCVSAADTVRAVGDALAVAQPGETARVGLALAQLGEVLVVLDDADSAEAAEAVETLSALAPRAWFLATATRPLNDAASLAPPPAFAPPPPDPADLAALPSSVEWLAHLPAGAPVDQIDALSESVRARIHPRRVALQPRVAVALRQQRPCSPELAARRCAHLGTRFLPLATGGEVRGAIAHEDVLLLRFLGQFLPDPVDASLNTVAAARLLARTGQPEEGLSMLAAFRDRVRRLGLREEALLLWAEGDVLLGAGLEGEARLCHNLALERLEDVRDPDLGGTLSRRRADHLLLRGHVLEAERHYKAARVLHRRAGDAVAVAATLRGVADVAVAAGEHVAAGTLYEQAAATLEGHPRARLELANLRLGQAALAIGRGELSEAERLLDEARQLGQGSELLQTLTLRRRAELLLRRGRHHEARQLLDTVAADLFRLGERAAAAATFRVQGDVEAAAGELADAAEHYCHALSEAARVGDLATANRTLEHLLALERTGGDVARVETLQGLLADVRALQVEGDETTSARSS